MKIAHLAAAVALTLVPACAAPPADEAGATESALSGSGDVLAIGDSITYGWNPYLTPVGQPTGKYTSYADDLTDGAVINAACPGESSASFFDPNGKDNNCKPDDSGGGPHYKRWLKTPWNAPTQADWMTKWLTAKVEANKAPKLVVLTLGGNDLFIVTGTGCTGAICNLTEVLAVAAPRYAANMKTIFQRIADTGYRGLVVVPNIYSLDYASWSEWIGIGRFNSALRGAVSDFNAGASTDMRVVVADAYESFKSAANGGSSCAAGLLIPTPNKPGECDVHPSALGRQKMAEAIDAAVSAAAPWGAEAPPTP